MNAELSEDFNNHPKCYTKSILGFSSDESVIIDIEPLKKLLEHSDVRYRQIVAFSMIEGLGKNENSLFNSTMNYMYLNYKSIILSMTQL
ncbi:hypothetical protein PVAND_015451 [Polypedilum vanderplanki]|uniref:Uncharacterized protein n=1 Tax=Polypedilum vanderplanki TaxID=319348 RepID=A0A9J6BCV6_POLVA|nr:hypothetical protein PVAND_015451 [Polypedilum vanderplanki]